MKKETKPKVDRAMAISVMGKKQFNKEVVQEIYAGVDPQEAPDLVARRKLKGMI